MPKWIWWTAIMGLIAIVSMYLFLTPKTQYSFINLSGILGTYITICGFVITLWQIHALKTTSEATETAIAETRNDIKRVSTVADISKQLIIIRQIKENVRDDKYDIAQLRLYELKDFLSSMEQEEGLRINKENLKAILKGTRTQLFAVDSKLNSDMEINKETFSKAMEKIASGLVGLKTNL